MCIVIKNTWVKSFWTFLVEKILYRPTVQSKYICIMWNRTTELVQVRVIHPNRKIIWCKNVSQTHNIVPDMSWIGWWKLILGFSDEVHEGEGAKIQLPLKNLCPNSGTDLFPNLQLVDARIFNHQNFTSISTDGQMPDGYWSTSGWVTSCRKSPKVECLSWGKRPTLKRSMEESWCFQKKMVMMMMTDDTYKTRMLTITPQKHVNGKPSK